MNDGTAVADLQTNVYGLIREAIDLYIFNCLVCLGSVSELRGVLPKEVEAEASKIIFKIFFSVQKQDCIVKCVPITLKKV
jgi:hypothetical protein